MSNNPKNREQNLKVKLSPQQSDPGRARPEDFEILHDYDADQTVPFHRQSGDSPAEFHRLLKEGLADQGKSLPRPTPERHYVQSKHSTP